MIGGNMKGLKVSPTSWRIWVHPKEVDSFFLNPNVLFLDLFGSCKAVVAGVSRLPNETIVIDVEVMA